MDWRPSDGLEVEDDEDLDGLRQKSSNGPEAMLGVDRSCILGLVACLCYVTLHIREVVLGVVCVCLGVVCFLI